MYIWTKLHLTFVIYKVKKHHSQFFIRTCDRHWSVYCFLGFFCCFFVVFYLYMHIHTYSFSKISLYPWFCLHIYSVSPSTATGHKHFAAHCVVALNNSSFKSLGQFQCGLNLSTNFSNLWCILSGVWVDTLPSPRGASGLNLISSSKCSLTWIMMT